MKKMSLITLLMIGCVCLNYSCGETDKKENSENLKQIPHIIDGEVIPEPKADEHFFSDSLSQFPEVHKLAEELEKNSKGKSNLSIWVGAEPTEAEPFYRMKVGEDNGERLITVMDFNCYPSDKKILFYDVVRDSTLTLEDWRKEQK